MAERSWSPTRTRTPLPRSSSSAGPPSRPEPAEEPGHAGRPRDTTARHLGGVLHELLAQGVAEPVARPEPITEPITDPGAIEARLRALAAQRAPVLVRVDGELIRGHVVPLYSDGPYPVRVQLPVRVNGPFDLDITGYNSLYRFHVPRSLAVEDTLALPLPTRLLRLQHRRTRRAAAPAGVRVQFRHPVFPELEINRAAVDLSRHGIAMETRPDQDLLCAGLKLDEVLVTLPAGLTLTFSAAVRILHPRRDGQGPAAGLRLTPGSIADARRWEQFVGDQLNPHTQLGGAWSEDTWALYTEAGYFNLSGKSQAHFSPAKAAFASVSRKVDAAPELGCQVTWPSEQGVEASLSLLKVYTHTWFGFQMAKISGPSANGCSGRQVLRDIHLRAYEHAHADPSIRWTMALVQSAAQWSKLVHYDLPYRYRDSGLACVVPFHALELDVPTRARKATEGLIVADATSGEQERFLDDLSRRRPWAYREALDLVPARFDLGELQGLWRGAGLTRERGLLVARRGGTPVAYALVESADPGLHLFDLLDTVRLYAANADGTRAFPALLDSAASWYRARGRSQFTCLLEEGAPTCTSALGTRDLGAGSVTLLSTDLLPSFFEHVDEVTSPRLTRS